MTARRPDMRRLAGSLLIAFPLAFGGAVAMRAIGADALWFYVFGWALGGLCLYHAFAVSRYDERASLLEAAFLRIRMKRLEEIEELTASETHQLLEELRYELSLSRRHRIARRFEVLRFVLMHSRGAIALVLLGLAVPIGTIIAGGAISGIIAFALVVVTLAVIELLGARRGLKHGAKEDDD